MLFTIYVYVSSIQLTLSVSLLAGLQRLLIGVGCTVFFYSVESHFSVGFVATQEFAVSLGQVHTISLMETLHFVCGCLTN